MPPTPPALIVMEQPVYITELFYFEMKVIAQTLTKLTKLLSGWQYQSIVARTLLKSGRGTEGDCHWVVRRSRYRAALLLMISSAIYQTFPTPRELLLKATIPKTLVAY